MNNLLPNPDQHNSTLSTQIATQIIDNLIKTSTQPINPQTYVRSPSIQQKSSDLQSTNAMTTTSQTNTSQKFIDDLANSRTQGTTIIQNYTLENQTMCYHLDKNGDLIAKSLDITKIKYYFIKIGLEFGMSVMRDLQNIVTVKTQKQSSIKCIFLMCLPVISEDSVYQLQKYKTTKGCKIKLSLISGNQQHFNEFRITFYQHLWQKNQLTLTNFQALNLLCFTHKKIMKQIAYNYEEITNKLQNKKSPTQIELEELQLLKKFKISEDILIQTILTENNKKLINNEQNRTIIQRIMMNEVPIYQFYLKLQNKTNTQFLNKRNKLLKHLSLQMVLNHLELDDKILEQTSCNYNKPLQEIINDSLPCASAIHFLNALSISFSANDNIKLITNFQKQLISSCKIKPPKPSYCLIDMDNQLPLTIYCVLISTNFTLKPIITFLQDYFQTEDQFSNQNRILTALIVSLEYIRNQWDCQQRNNQ